KFQDIAVLQNGSVVDWLLEAHHQANIHAYVIPPDAEQGNAYYEANRPVLEDQLLKAGVRLAKILNDAFDQNPLLQAASKPVTSDPAQQSLQEQSQNDRGDEKPKNTTWFWIVIVISIFVVVYAISAIVLNFEAKQSGNTTTRIGWLARAAL